VRLDVALPGRVEYGRAVAWQEALVARRLAGGRDALLLLEHPPVYTLGRGADPAHLRAAASGDVPVVRAHRGGQVTYHGPGQLVAYVLVDLARAKLGIRAMVRRLEEAVIQWLDSSGISAYGKTAAPGVYVSRDGVEAKIAALGLKVRNGRTYHGLAVNDAMDLGPFADIDPCGFPGLEVTQLSDLGVAMSVERAGETLAPILTRTIARPTP